MMNAHRKLAEIQSVVATWQESGRTLTSYEAMTEIRDVLEGLPRAPSSLMDDDRMPAPRALRAKSSLLG